MQDDIKKLFTGQTWNGTSPAALMAKRGKISITTSSILIDIWELSSIIKTTFTYTLDLVLFLWGSNYRNNNLMVSVLSHSVMDHSLGSSPNVYYSDLFQEWRYSQRQLFRGQTRQKSCYCWRVNSVNFEIIQSKNGHCQTKFKSPTFRIRPMRVAPRAPYFPAYKDPQPEGWPNFNSSICSLLRQSTKSIREYSDVQFSSSSPLGFFCRWKIC